MARRSFRLRAIPFLVCLPALSAEADRVRLTGSVPFGDNDSHLIVFPHDFSFPFGGVSYKSCSIGSDGVISFQQPLVSGPMSGSTAAAFLLGQPRLAPLWIDLDPSRGGTITAGRVSADAYEIRWNSVASGPSSPGGAFTFGCVLRTDGSFRFQYGSLVPGPTVPSEALVGFATGFANTRGTGTAVSFASMTCPSAWGNGSEAAIYETFRPAGNVAVLMNSTLCFNPTHQTGRLTFSDDEAVEVGLTGWTFPFHGNRYTSVWIGSNGYVTFGGPDTAWSPWPTAFVGGVGRVAAFWSDLDPSAGGEVLVTQSAGSMTVTWNNLPYYLTPGTASCSLTLNGDGTIYLSWGPVAPQPVLVLVGQTAGYPATMGTEGPAPLTPGGIHGSGPGAVYDMMIATSFPYASNQVAFDAAHTANAHPLPIGNDGAVEVLFPGGFTFPFGTGRHDAAFFNADGYLSFGGTDGARFGTPARLLGFFPRICGLWADYRTMLYGGPEAVLTVVAGPGTLAFRWYLGAAQFAILLRTDGSFSLVYGAVSSPATSVAGYSTGGGTATGSEAQVALTSRTSWGSGTETAIFQEVLTPSTLAWQTFSFAPAGPILYQRPVTSPGAIPIALGAGAADAGLVWVIGAALGSQPGIALPGCGTIPLNPDPVLQLTMGGALIQPFLGALDGRGERTGWPVARLSPVTLQVPAGLGGLGLVLWVAIVTVAPPGSPCPFRTISPAVPFRI